MTLIAEFAARPETMNTTLDHLVIAGTDLSALVAWWTQQTGAPPEAGGSHKGVGTKNALVGIGQHSYIELIGPDTAQGDPAQPRPFGIDGMEPNSIRLVTCALAVDDLDAACSAVRSSGIDPGDIRPMSRLRPDGVELSWRLAVPQDPELGGAMPFLIEWGAGTPHPAASLRPVVGVDELTLCHPDPGPIRSSLDALGLDRSGEAINVAEAPAGVFARLTTLVGEMEL